MAFSYAVYELFKVHIYLVWAFMTGDYNDYKILNRKVRICKYNVSVNANTSSPIILGIKDKMNDGQTYRQLTDNC